MDEHRDDPRLGRVADVPVPVGVHGLNATAKHLVGQHGGNFCSTFPGQGFDNLTAATSCTYLLDSDGRILSVVLETDADEPLDEVGDFFVQQIRLTKDPTEKMRSAGIGQAYGGVLIVRLALDDVPAWQRSVIEQRIADSLTVVSRSTWEWSDEDA